MTAPEGRPRLGVEYGILVGAVVAIFVFIPVTAALQRELDVPIPNPAHRSNSHPVDVAASYWISWPVSWLALAIPGTFASISPLLRRAATGYLATTLVICGLAGAAMIGFELTDFAPT